MSFPRRIIMVVFALLSGVLCACSQGNYKVLEKSGKRPDWVNGSLNNYIITYGSGNTVEEAKNECLKNIRDQIISAVAITVRSKTEVNIEQRNGVTDEKFKYSIISQSAKLPYLQGISLSKSKGFYWEKVIDKSDKSIKFGYNVMYPFSNAELAQLIDEYEKQEAELNAKIQGYTLAVDTASSVASFRNTLEQLTLLENTLIDDRKDKVTSAKVALNAVISSLQLVPLSNNPGDLTFVLKNRNKVIRTYETPSWKSNCGKMTSISFSDTASRILYTYDLCKYTDNPVANIEYDMGGTNLSFEFHIDVNANKVEVNIGSDVNISKTKDSGSWITQAICEFSINSKYAFPFEIRRIDLKPDNQLPWIATGLNIRVDKKGIKTLKLNLNQQIDKNTYSSKNKAFPYITVNIYYKNLNNGLESVTSLSNQKYITDW